MAAVTKLVRTKAFSRRLAIWREVVSGMSPVDTLGFSDGTLGKWVGFEVAAPPLCQESCRLWKR